MKKQVRLLRSIAVKRKQEIKKGSAKMREVTSLSSPFPLKKPLLTKLTKKVLSNLECCSQNEKGENQSILSDTAVRRKWKICIKAF